MSKFIRENKSRISNKSLTRLFLFKVLHGLVVLGKVLSVEDVIDCVTRANDTNDCTPVFVHLQAVSFVVVVFDLGLLEYLVGQYLASSSNAKAIFS